jgi:hypothetical protein
MSNIARTVAGLYPSSEIIAQLSPCRDSSAAREPSGTQRPNASAMSARSSSVRPRPAFAGAGQ